VALTTIECPHCGVLTDSDTESSYVHCSACGRLVSVAAQLAFARASELYEEGQEAGLTVLPREPRNRRARNPAPAENQESALRGYQRACSGLRLAFGAALPESQRVAGLEMMAEMSQVLASRGRFSGLEAQYWVDVLIEENSLKEEAEITHRLHHERGRGAFALLRRLHLRVRRRQLRAALRRLTQRIEDAEDALDLAEQFYARREGRHSA